MTRVHVLPKLVEVVAAELLDAVILLVRADGKLPKIRNLLQARRVRLHHQIVVLQLVLILDPLPILRKVLTIVVLRLVLLPLEVEGLVAGPAVFVPEHLRLLMTDLAVALRRVRHLGVAELYTSVA